MGDFCVQRSRAKHEDRRGVFLPRRICSHDGKGPETVMRIGPVVTTVQKSDAAEGKEATSEMNLEFIVVVH